MVRPGSWAAAALARCGACIPASEDPNPQSAVWCSVIGRKLVRISEIQYCKRMCHAALPTTRSAPTQSSDRWLDISLAFQVFKALLDNNEEVAIKFLNPSDVGVQEAQRDRFKMEIQIARLCCHEYVVRCLGAYADKVCSTSSVHPLMTAQVCVSGNKLHVWWRHALTSASAAYCDRKQQTDCRACASSARTV